MILQLTTHQERGFEETKKKKGETQVPKFYMDLQGGHSKGQKVPTGFPQKGLEESLEKEKTGKNLLRTGSKFVDIRGGTIQGGLQRGGKGAQTEWLVILAWGALDGKGDGRVSLVSA